MSSNERDIKRFLEEDAPERKRPREDVLSSGENPGLIALCDAAAHLTKALLALGAENNLDDVLTSRGRSWEAGKYRTNWLYLSRTDHGVREETSAKRDDEGWQKLFEVGLRQTFFYHIPAYEPKNAHKNYVARNAACAVLSLTGNCDQHAFVLATLLRAILPIGTPINICGMRMRGRDFPHTFVVIGDLGSERIISLMGPGAKKLLVVDAWPAQGGAVCLEDFFVCEGALHAAQLVVDLRFIADGQDHLVKRVAKQKILHDILKAEDADVEVQPSVSLRGMFLHHELAEQINYTQQICRHRYLPASLEEYGIGMFAAPAISSRYSTPEGSAAAYDYILNHYPDERFKRCIEYVREKTVEMIEYDKSLDEDFSERLNIIPRI
ncbi:hypothetical protein [Legionella nagasakiensis]|uniref:hypothetical protein n=1 Tax=Legionella nagasakiensis TaxID=535290 RepID=UPI001056A473|nr:hypothetical protein [Legionella nagasakiensis]